MPGRRVSNDTMGNGWRERKLAFIRSYLRPRFGSSEAHDEWRADFHEHRFILDEPNGETYRLHVTEELLLSQRHPLSFIEESLQGWDPGAQPAIRLTPAGRQAVWLRDGLP